MKLIGDCNFCGACCFSKSGAVCENLEVLTQQGLPNGTRCRIYAQRYNGLPIRMITKNGRILTGYYCAKNSAAEVKTIIELGIKKGVCSLNLRDQSQDGQSDRSHDSAEGAGAGG